MARKREAEAQEAAKAQESSERQKHAARNGKDGQSRHSAYRQSQNLSQRPGSFLRRSDGQDKSRNGGERGLNGQDRAPGAPPSGNRPIDPFR